ncbi:hypothetical protein QE152_g25115 [Popillia japonica]|uniref:Uncharacterized protein n=1 Tax=Popillia japonica TaxID=7064 RepID=A0AAW1K182_POPJA
MDSLIFPKSFHFDEDLNVLVTFCRFNHLHKFDIIPSNPVDMLPLITNQTLMLYQNLRNSFYVDYTNLSFQLNSRTTFIDVYLYFANAFAFNFYGERLMEVFHNGVKRLQAQAKYSRQITHLAVMTKLFARTYSADNTAWYNESSTFVLGSITNKNKNISGVVLYSDNTIEHLTSTSSTKEFMIILLNT